MPLKPEASIQDVTRITSRYAVSFFNKTLRHGGEYNKYLTDSEANRRDNPLVNFVKNCEKIKDHPLDLAAGDKITFMPSGSDGYQVSVIPGTAPV